MNDEDILKIPIIRSGLIMGIYQMVCRVVILFEANHGTRFSVMVYHAIQVLNRVLVELAQSSPLQAKSCANLRGL